jgi:DNA-binding LacI/PurR family transcriptional regulator
MSRSGFESARRLSLFGFDKSQALTRPAPMTEQLLKRLPRRARRDALRNLRTEHPPTAFLTVNGLTTIGVLRTLERAGLEVARDKAVIDFDNSELSTLLHSRLTVMRQPVGELGRRPAEFLLERLRQEDTAKPKHEVLGLELSVR